MEPDEKIIPWSKVKPMRKYELQAVTSQDARTHTRIGQPFVRRIGYERGGGTAQDTQAFAHGGAVFTTEELDWQGKPYIARKLCSHYIVLRETI